MLVKFSFDQYQAEKDPWLTAAINYEKKADSGQKAIPTELVKSLIGSYKLEGHKLNIVEEDGKVFLTMNRKIKSFFELNTELYFHSEEKLATDITDVYLNYDSSNKPVLIEWKGISLTF